MSKKYKDSRKKVKRKRLYCKCDLCGKKQNVLSIGTVPKGWMKTGLKSGICATCNLYHMNC